MVLYHQRMINGQLHMPIRDSYEYLLRRLLADKALVRTPLELADLWMERERCLRAGSFRFSGRGDAS